MTKTTYGNMPVINVNSLQTLQLRRQQIHAELMRKENHMNSLWHDLIAPPPESSSASLTQRIMAHVASASVLIDGAMLGWKIYRRFGGSFRPFRKKKK